MKQKREQRKSQSKPQEEVQDQKTVSAPPDMVTTDLLDEIDEVLEVNSEEFVTSYVQRGGD